MSAALLVLPWLLMGIHIVEELYKELRHSSDYLRCQANRPFETSLKSCKSRVEISKMRTTIFPARALGELACLSDCMIGFFSRKTREVTPTKSTEIPQSKRTYDRHFY